MNRPVTQVLALALLMLSVVFSVLLVGQARLEKRLIHENETLWKENMDKTVQIIRLEGKITDLERALDDRALVEFNPQALTPREAKKRK